MPEEVNRRLIDHSSDVLMPYTDRARANLLREGIRGDRIFVIGNPIFEVLNHYDDRISNSRILEKLGFKKGGGTVPARGTARAAGAQRAVDHGHEL